MRILLGIDKERVLMDRARYLIGVNLGEECISSFEHFARLLIARKRGGQLFLESQLADIGRSSDRVARQLSVDLENRPEGQRLNQVFNFIRNHTVVYYLERKDCSCQDENRAPLLYDNNN